MPPEPAPVADDPAFPAWLRTLDDELGTDLTDHLGSPGALGFLWTVFTRNGAMPGAYFAPLIGEFRREHAERTVAALLARVRADTGRALAVPVTYEPPDPDGLAGQVTAGHEHVWGVDPADLAVQAAEGVQCLLADRDRLLWPVCPDHGTAPHATWTPGGAAWVCSVTAHPVAPIPC